MIELTFDALSEFPASNIGAARGTLVVVRIVIRAAHWYIVLRTITRNYAINQIHGSNSVLVARCVTRNFKYVE